MSLSTEAESFSAPFYQRRAFHDNSMPRSHLEYPDSCGSATTVASVEPTSSKTDFKKTITAYSARRGRFEIVEVPPLAYLAVDGSGDPNTSAEYAAALGALYPLAYTLKFASKVLSKDYVVMPLEALWWAKDMNAFTVDRDKSQWNWTAMIMIPDWIDTAMFHAAVAAVQKKFRDSKRDCPVRLCDVRLLLLEEGMSVQTLHIGPYDEEAAVLSTMHNEFIPAAQLHMTGKHHEIYLNDVRRTAPSKLRTILRQPVSPAGESNRTAQ